MGIQKLCCTGAVLFQVLVSGLPARMNFDGKPDQQVVNPVPHPASIVRNHRPEFAIYENFYREIHRDPEISGLEERTASVVAAHLRRLGFEVHTGIGVHGVVGVLSNGPGKTVLIRAELDALPVREQTNLPYKSTKVMIDRYGSERPVMHACGHDMNMAALLAASDLLQSAKLRWNGTLLTLFQPDEEETGGARAMINDGLYSKVPVPDIMLAQHVVASDTGQVSIRSGTVLAAAEAVRVRIIGGPCPNTPNPQHCVDPISVATNITLKLQDVVNQELGPGDLAKVACWGIHAGHPGNDYVAYVDFLLDIKTVSPGTRSKALNVVKKFIKTQCYKFKTPRDPIFNITTRAPLTVNSPFVERPLTAAFDEFFASGALDIATDWATEDFSTLGAEHNIPYAYWNFGGSRPVRKEETRPTNHSPFFGPEIQPTLQTGTDAMALAVLTFLSADQKDSAGGGSR